MKHHLSSRLVLFMAVFSLSFTLLRPGAAAQQDSGHNNEITAAIAANRWVFNAQRSDPSIGRSSFLSSGYEVRCSGDTAVFNLPYSGQLQAPARFPGGKGPLDFTSTDFSVTKLQKGNGKWVVTLKPGDQADVISCTFTFFENGRASLDVLFINRTPMYFYGTVEPLK
ncbi:MAG: DUF4251 domain-containing protein [Bacteroidota bacterium]